jgi:hypothetical protein
MKVAVQLCNRHTHSKGHILRLHTVKPWSHWCLWQQLPQSKWCGMGRRLSLDPTGQAQVVPRITEPTVLVSEPQYVEKFPVTLGWIKEMPGPVVPEVTGWNGTFTRTCGMCTVDARIYVTSNCRDEVLNTKDPFQLVPGLIALLATFVELWCTSLDSPWHVQITFGLMALESMLLEV